MTMIKTARRLAGLALVLAAAGTWPAGAQEAEAPPAAPMTVQDEVLYASACINAGMLLLRFTAEDDAEKAELLNDEVSFWLKRHEALEPDEARRQEQWRQAAERIVESGGDDPAGIEPGLSVLLANCHTRRIDILRDFTGR